MEDAELGVKEVAITTAKELLSITTPLSIFPTSTIKIARTPWFLHHATSVTQMVDIHLEPGVENLPHPQPPRPPLPLEPQLHLLPMAATCANLKTPDVPKRNNVRLMFVMVLAE